MCGDYKTTRDEIPNRLRFIIIMAKYKGKNNNRTAIGQTLYRAQYQRGAFRNSSVDGTSQHESIVEFNLSERRYYGKIDHENDPVVVNNKSLFSIKDSNNPQKANLVCAPVDSMFLDFQNKLSQGTLIGLNKIPNNDPYLAKPQVYQAHKDPIVEYRNYMSNVLEAFNDVWLANEEYSNSVTDIDGYVKQFLKYVGTMKSDFPVTLTAWRKSRHSSILSTGIALTISDLDCSVDENAEHFILGKNCETFYYQACKQYGFSITKKCPWLLVADLGSVATMDYLASSGVSSVRMFFKRNYTKTYLLDINLLRSIIRNSYIIYINNNNYIKDINICDNDNNKLISKNIFRKSITQKTYDLQYSDYYWIPYYVRIRNIEDEMPYDEPSIERIIQKASQFEKLLDKEKAMSYINEQFRKKYKYAHGSYFYYAGRIKAKQRLEG